MTKQATTILIVLVLLTLGGLLLVSNLISEKKSSETALSAAAGIAHSSPNPAPATRATSGGASLESDLHFAQAQLDGLSDAIKNSDWAQAQTLFDSFELKDRRLPAPQLKHPEISPLLQDFFDLYTVQLERAISEKQPKPAYLAINQLTGILSETQARFIKGATPVEVQRLRYLIREISFWHEVGDERMSRARIAALREAWEEASALVRARRQGEAVAQQFEALLARAAAAENISQVAATLPAFDQSLDRIEALFQSNTRATGESGNPGGDQ